MQLRSYARLVRDSREQGDWEKIAVYALWVGLYWEASRVLRVEHIAARERRAMTGRRKAHAATHGTEEEKAARWTAYQEKLNTLAIQHPNWKLTALRQEVAKHFHVSFKTIERHTKDPHN